MSGRRTSAGRRLLALVALTLAATMTATTAAFGLSVPTVSTPKVRLPAHPQVPAVPGVPLPQAPAAPAPKSPVPLPALPSPGGHAAPAPGAAPARPGRAPQTVADAVAANGVALAPRPRSAGGPTRGGGSSSGRAARPTTQQQQRRAAAGRGARERRFRRDVRRLSGCISALPGLERRVLVLRAGLQGQRAHSRRFTARRLGISLRRTAAAERGGLRRLRRAGRSSGCATPAAAGPATSNRALAGAPVVAGLLGSAATPGAAAAAPRDASGVSRASASAPPKLAGAPERSAAADGGSQRLPPLVIALALAAAALALAVRPGWRVAHGALVERTERSTDRRQAELAATVRGILGD